jgi:urease accessory protein
MFRSIVTVVGIACALGWAAAAHAGEQQVISFAAGVAHPLGGVDHILAMAAVGVWGVLAGGRAVWVWPAAFVATMLAGFVAATLGLQLPLVSAAISSSIIVFGILVSLAVKAPVWVGAGVVALFAFFHGHAHGTEATAASLVAYGVGFALATGGLQGAGIGLGLLAEGSIGKVAVRALGALALFGGVALIGG